MSNRPHRRRRRDVLAGTYAAIGGQRLPGGCDDCGAYQVLTREAKRVYVLHVYHDDTCPFLAAHERRSA